MTNPGAGGHDADKYAVGEYERRFLVTTMPERSHTRLITDAYIRGTRLRLRTVEGPDGDVVLKLGHKRRVTDQPTAIMHTSLYLDAGEHDVLAALPAQVLTKQRSTVVVGGWAVAIDEFTGSLEGLVLAEVEAGQPEETARFSPPSWLGPEVTTIEALTGGALAGRHWSDIEPIVRALRSD